jgi:hypothetical protein
MGPSRWWPEDECGPERMEWACKQCQYKKFTKIKDAE